ncbi:MAG: hypothetical protein P9M00_07875 [Candidatus Tritonobacter lacicola]|nr:hypothetical protein [Candidatus Tritonobacter lacicola]
MMNYTKVFFTLCLVAPLVIYTGCKRDKNGEGDKSSSPAEEIASKKPTESSKNVALNKSYTVNPSPNGYADTYTADATDGRKPVAMESCFGYSRNNDSMDVTLDIDLGREEKIHAATLYTFFSKFDLQDNVCDYGANYVEVYGSTNGNFGGEEKLLGKAGEPESALGEAGQCAFETQFAPYKCRYVRFSISKQFGDGATGTDWLFIKEAEVWMASH